MIKREVVKKVVEEVNTYCRLMYKSPEFLDEWQERACGVLIFVSATLGIIDDDMEQRLSEKITQSYMEVWKEKNI